MKWNSIEIVIVENALQVIINRNNLLIEGLSNPAFEDTNGGTTGFGCNGAVCSFSDIKMSIVMPDAFMKFIASIRVSSKSKQEKKIADTEEEEAIAQEEGAKNLDKPEEEVML